MKGSGTTPLDSSRLRVEGLYKYSWFNTSVGTHKLYLTYEYEQYEVMQDIREIELRDSGSNANTKICFEVRVTALRLHLHTKGFPLRPYRTFHKRTST